VNVAGWNLSDLTLMAASAMSFTLTATATERSAAGNTSTAQAFEPVTVNAATTNGAPQLPNLFSSYPVRPSWQVAGVDYAVGLPAGTALKDPLVQSNLPAGTSINTTYNFVSVNANNVTLSGFDFSLHGGVQVFIAPGVTGTTITDNYFGGDNNIPLRISPGANNTVFTHNTIDGAGPSNTGVAVMGELIYNQGGNLTVEYNYIHDSGSRFLGEYGSGTLIYDYNLLENAGEDAGAHGNFIEWNSSGTFTNPQVDYNTIVQSITQSGAEAIQMYDQTSTGSIVNGDIGWNTIISVPTQLVDADYNGGGTGPAMSYLIHAGSGGAGNAPATGVVHDNFMDATSAFGALYPNLTGFTYSDNINLVTGAQIPSP